jgi:hypothetical protein
MPSIFPSNAPADFVPFYASTMELAEKYRATIEDYHRHRMEMILDWDEMDPDKHITVSFKYSPKHLITDWCISSD